MLLEALNQLWQKQTADKTILTPKLLLDGGIDDEMGGDGV
jgi:hypothetical protein